MVFLPVLGFPRKSSGVFFPALLFDILLLFDIIIRLLVNRTYSFFPLLFYLSLTATIIGNLASQSYGLSCVQRSLILRQNKVLRMECN